MKICIFYESSGIVREAFRAKGYDAWSCDVQAADDGSKFHIQGDAIDHLDDGWDMLGFHPPCTFVNGAGIHWNNRGRGWDRTEHAVNYARALMKRREPWYLENPVGILSTRIRRPDQTIQPHNFGDDASKKTCLWLHRLPLLEADPRKRVAGRIVIWKGKRVERWANQTDSGQNRLGPSETRWKDRSRTYPGIARAMADQWGDFLSQIPPGKNMLT